MSPKVKFSDDSGFTQKAPKEHKRIRQEKIRKAREDKFAGKDPPDFVTYVNKMEKKHRRSMDVWENLKVFSNLKLYDEDEPEPHCHDVFFDLWYPSCKTLRRSKKRLSNSVPSDIDLWYDYINDKSNLPYPSPHSDDKVIDEDDLSTIFVDSLSRFRKVFENLLTFNVDNDIYVRVLEDIVAIASLCFDKTAKWHHILITSISIIKGYAGCSFTSLLEKQLSAFLDLKSPEPQSFFSPGALRNLTSIMRGKFFKQFHRLLVVLISYGFISPINITIKNLEIFSAKTEDIHNNATDLVDYILDTVTYFFDTGYRLFKGDYSVFTDMDELNRIDRDIIFLKSHIDSVHSGNLFKMTGKTIGEYKDLLIKTHLEVEFMSRNIKDKYVKLNVMNKLEALSTLIVRFNSLNYMGGMRRAPFSVSLYGLSDVGKSGVANIIINSICKSNGLDIDDEQICTLQPDDKFYSTFKHNTLAVIIDDVNNTQSSKATVNPAAMIISLVNNIKYSAPKADTKDKGAFQVAPHVVIVTTNTKNLGASEWSNEPLSVLRRLRYHIKVKVRPQYSKNLGKFDGSKLTSADLQFSMENGYGDYWLFTVEQAVAKSVPSNMGGSEPYDFALVSDEEGELVDITIMRLIRFLNVQSAIFYAEQDNLVETSKNAGKRMKFCKECKNFLNVCTCANVEEPEPQSFIAQGVSDFVVDKFSSVLYQKMMGFYQSLMPTPVEGFVADMTGYSLAKYIVNRHLSLLRFIPMSVRESDLYRSFHFYTNRKKLVKYSSYVAFASSAIIGASSYAFTKKKKFSFFAGLIGLLPSSVVAWRSLYSRSMDELRVVPYCELIDPHTAEQAIKATVRVGVSIGIGLTVIKTIKSLYAMYNTQPHGNLSPCNGDDYNQRDQEKCHWSKSASVFTSLDVTKTMSAEQLINKIKGNCLHASYTINGRERTTSIIALRSNVFMCPYHFFHENCNILSNKVTGSDHNGVFNKGIIFLKVVRSSSSFFYYNLEIEDIVRVGKLDACIFSMSSGGTFLNILPLVSQDSGYNGPIRVVHRDLAGDINMDVGDATYGKYSYRTGFTTINYDGYKYDLLNETKRGMCSAPIISECVGPSIIGFHIAGHTGRPTGYSLFVGRSLLESAINSHFKLTGRIEPHSSGDFCEVRYNRSLNYMEKVSNDSPVCWQEKEPYLIRGSVGTQATYSSNIRPSILAKSFREVTGSPIVWGPPKFRPSWKPWSDHLTHACKPVMNLPSMLLQRSVQDYLKPLLKIMDRITDFTPNRPLTKNEIVNGIHGIRFIDSMNMNSSFGFPLSGSKRKYLEGEPGEMHFINQDDIDYEIARMENAYIHGVRFYPIFKACLKDEPVRVEKDKVRVFHAADMSLQFMLRKYYLPVLRFINMHPLETECAVGINCHSNEWDQMHMYITFNGTLDDRILAGDYSKWDIRLPPDLVLAAFNVLITLARNMNSYTEQELIIMQGLATDVTYFTCHFNGTLIEFMSGVPSGHNLTAVLNSICNSLLLRCGYFHLKNGGNFRDNVHAMTYGDDFFSGVSKNVKRYNHLLYRDFLAIYGMVLTMPIKDMKAEPFLNIWKCDFLKRRSVICPYDGIIYGALDLESIHKSLVVKGKTSIGARIHAYEVLSGAVRELSYHSKDTYDEWIEVYRKIALENDFLISDLSYDHFGYYKRRNDMEENIITDDLRIGPSSLVGYPMILEASDDDEFSYPNEISSLEESSEFEFDHSLDFNGLTNNNNNESYPTTTMWEGCVDPLQHMEPEPHSNVLGNEPYTQDAAHMESGILHLSGAKEESVIETKLVSSELLSLRQNESRSLQNYLSRPALIANISLENVNQTLYFNILALFLTQFRIREKIRYYAYLNGVLNVKVTVVGSPQCSGAYMIGLHPWWARDNGIGALGGTTAVTPHPTQISQLPSFVCDVGMETGGHIRMPIIAPTNGLNISEYEQIQESFRLYVEQLVPFTVPTGSTISPSLQVYAWIEDAVLTGTTLKSELPTPQSDEFTKEPNDVGDSATTDFKTGVAKAAGKITGMATEIGVDALMSAMGFSQPLRPEGVTPIVPRAITNMACYNSEQNIDSLASDIKNQVSVGTEELGYIDVDHMSLSSINRRWSYLGSFSKATDNTLGSVGDTTIIQVSPLSVPTAFLGVDTLYYPTALAASTLPFSKWRGGMEYKFTAVGSAFLKGKLKIAHDVNSNINLSSAVYAPLDTQALNNIIWDVSQYRSLVVQVPWSSNLAFKDTGLMRPWIEEGLNAPTGYDLSSNGVLLIDKMTLMSDLEYPSFRILVHVRAMEGFAYGDVRAVLANYTFAGVNYGQSAGVPEPQSDEPLPRGIIKSEDGKLVLIFATADNVEFYNNYLRTEFDAPEPQSDIKTAYADVTTFGGQQSDTLMVVNINGMENNIDDHGKMMELCMGEKFFTIRQIIKRYTENFTRNYNHSGTTAQYLRRLVIPDKPLMKGWQGTPSISLTPTGKKATYARDSFLSFFSMCYLGYRGSFRHKVSLTSNDQARSLMMYVARAPPGYIDVGILHNAQNATGTQALSGPASSSILSSPDVRAGGLVSYMTVNPIVEYSTPFQCRAKFAWAQDRTPQSIKFSYDGGYDIPWHQIAYATSEASTKWVRLNKFVAAGDDFSLFFYLYPPVMVNASPGIHSQA